jgi:hypothetical protein
MGWIAASANSKKGKTLSHREVKRSLAKELHREPTDYVKISRRLESEIGKPVVTSCQAYIWYALESAHVKEKISGYGKLMGTLGGVTAESQIAMSLRNVLDNPVQKVTLRFAYGR